MTGILDTVKEKNYMILNKFLCMCAKPVEAEEKQLRGYEYIVCNFLGSERNLSWGKNGIKTLFAMTSFKNLKFCPNEENTKHYKI